MIENLVDLENYARRNKNTRLLGLVLKAKYGNLEQQFLAIASILKTLRRKNISFSQHLLNEFLLCVCRRGGNGLVEG